jgi:hypothetical protein
MERDLELGGNPGGNANCRGIALKYTMRDGACPVSPIFCAYPFSVAISITNRYRTSLFNTRSYASFTF